MVQAGTVIELWRFPVKSMAGERLEAAELTRNGVLGDRAYALVDAATGKVLSASAKLFPGMMDCSAVFAEPPRPGQALPPVRITLPNGRTIASDSGRADQELSAHFGRDVTLARLSAEHYAGDPNHADPAGHRDPAGEQKRTAFFAAAGMPSPLPAGSFFDLFPLSVITNATLRRLGELQPQSRFDQRRFRMNIIVETPAKGFVENDWVGNGLHVGNEARLGVAMPDLRCVMTTLAQGELAKDPEIMRTLTLHNRLEIPGAGRLPCAGVYAVVNVPGRLRVGDPVLVVPSSLRLSAM